MKKFLFLLLISALLTFSCAQKNSAPQKTDNQKIYQNSHISTEQALLSLIQENADLKKKQDMFFNYFLWLIATIVVGAVILILLNVRESRQKDKIILSSKQFLHHSIEVQEAERKRLSYELHDSVAQNLRYVTLLAENLKEKEEAAKIISIQNENIEAIRKLCYNLTPPVLNESSMISSLEFLGEKIFDNEGDDFEFRIVAEDSVDFSVWSAENKLHIYRIIQEALQNIQKHAHASEVTVLFRDCHSENAPNTNAHLKIIITDDGIGMSNKLVNEINNGSFKSAQNLHFGIRNIIERVQLLGGKIKYSSEENCGTQIKVEI